MSEGKYFIHRDIKKSFYELKLNLVNYFEDDEENWEQFKYLLNNLDLAIDKIYDIREEESYER